MLQFVAVSWLLFQWITPIKVVVEIGGCGGITVRRIAKSHWEASFDHRHEPPTDIAAGLFAVHGREIRDTLLRSLDIPA
jgi:hypothetical protein